MADEVTSNTVVEPEYVDEKSQSKLSVSKDSSSLQQYDAENNSEGDDLVVSTAEEIITHVIHVDDDPTLNPWTFRMFFLGALTSDYVKVESLWK
jgi:hypothetical protein